MSDTPRWRIGDASSVEEWFNVNSVPCPGCGKLGTAMVIPQAYEWTPITKRKMIRVHCTDCDRSRMEYLPAPFIPEPPPADTLRTFDGEECL